MTNIAAKSDGIPEAISIITDLARKSAGTKLDVIKVDGNGLGSGLPKSVPVQVGECHEPKSIKRLIEEWRQSPERWEGTAEITSLQSFIALVNRHKHAEKSAIFARAEWPRPSLTAVIDYSGEAGSPTFRRHKVHYAFPVTKELSTWIEHNGQSLKQVQFAEFLEDRIADLAAPTEEETAKYKELFNTALANPMDLVVLSRGLSINVEQQVANHHKLNSGEAEIRFVEKHTNEKGDAIVVPGIFIISLPAFIGGEPVRIPVRLRYRVSGGNITWLYQLYCWEALLRERVKGDLMVAAEATSLPAFEGEPEETF